MEDRIDNTPINERMDETRTIGGQGSGTYRNGMPVMRETMPNVMNDEFKNAYHGYRQERRNKAEKNIFKKENHYKKYEAEDEVFETIIEHMTKGVKFHDKMMDLYGFLGLHGFKKMHEYQYYSECMERRKAKCYVLEHMNLLVADTCDEDGLNFMPANWYNYTRHDITPEARQQYVAPSFQGYKQWEEETKELLSYCANELMYMGKMAEFNEVMEMVEDVEKELNTLEELILKLQSVGFDMQYIMDMQDRICEEYENKLEECFEKKIKHDRKKKKHEAVYGMEQKPYARRTLPNRYMR